eukprot:m.184862 g.184862  ORF g.184862 m.184862 type:complete len:123 (-) comp15563_c2_seq8:1182-1550(-)
MYLLTQDEKYFVRALSEMDRSCSCTWASPTFLWTAEMTVSVSIGLDWLWDKLSTSNQTRYQACIVNNGINLEIFNHYSEDFKGNTNRNIVGHGGYVIGSIVIETTKKVLLHIRNQTLFHKVL